MNCGWNRVWTGLTSNKLAFHTPCFALLFRFFWKFPSSKPDSLILPSFSSKRCTIDIVNSISGWRYNGNTQQLLRSLEIMKPPIDCCDVWFTNIINSIFPFAYKHYPWFRDVSFSQWELKYKFYIKLITLTASQTIHSIATISKEIPFSTTVSKFRLFFRSSHLDGVSWLSMVCKGLWVSPRFLRRDIPMHASWLSCPPDQQCLVGTAGGLAGQVGTYCIVSWKRRP